MASVQTLRPPWGPQPCPEPPPPDLQGGLANGLTAGRGLGGGEPRWSSSLLPDRPSRPWWSRRRAGQSRQGPVLMNSVDTQPCPVPGRLTGSSAPCSADTEGPRARGLSL